MDLRKHAANGKLPSDPTAGKYNLQVVVVHEGSLDYGHYYTFAKVPIDNELCNLEKQHWIKLNDHEVTVVDEATVLETARGGASKAQPSRLNNMLQKKLGSNSVSTNAYILFYTQQD